MSWRGGSRKRWLWVAVAAVVAIVAVVAWLAYDRLLRREIPIYASDEEHFKYGSIGNDGETGLPYPSGASSPTVFAGSSARRRVAMPRSASAGKPAGAKPIRRSAFHGRGWGSSGWRSTAPSATSPRIGLLPAAPPVHARRGEQHPRYPRLSAFPHRQRARSALHAGRALPAMAERLELSWLDRLLYRYLLIPITRKRLIEQGDAFAWADKRPPGGRDGSIPSIRSSSGCCELPDDGTIGNSDMQAMWNLGREARDPRGCTAPLGRPQHFGERGGDQLGARRRHDRGRVRLFRDPAVDAPYRGVPRTDRAAAFALPSRSRGGRARPRRLHGGLRVMPRPIRGARS